MFKKQKKSGNRHSGRRDSSSFRRGNAVVSRSQREERAKREVASSRQESLTKKINRHQRRLKFYAVLAVVFGVIFIVRLSVSNVSINSSTELPAEVKATYQEYISEYIAKNSIFKQTWSFSDEELAEDFMKSFPEVSAVSISDRAPFSTTLKVQANFRQPVFSWKDASNEKRFLDQAGVLFTINRTSVKSDQLVRIEDESGLIFDSGNTALSSSTAKIIGELPVQFKDHFPTTEKTVITRIVIPKSTRELRVYPSSVAYYIKISTNRSLSEQVGDLKEVLAHLKKKKVTPKSYIDVRIENKVFYK
jgi:hypothetical protein